MAVVLAAITAAPGSRPARPAYLAAHPSVTRTDPLPLRSSRRDSAGVISGRRPRRAPEPLAPRGREPAASSSRLRLPRTMGSRSSPRFGLVLRPGAPPVPVRFPRRLCPASVPAVRPGRLSPPCVPGVCPGRLSSVRCPVPFPAAVRTRASGRPKQTAPERRADAAQRLSPTNTPPRTATHSRDGTGHSGQSRAASGTAASRGPGSGRGQGGQCRAVPAEPDDDDPAVPRTAPKIRLAAVSRPALRELSGYAGHHTDGDR